MIAPPDSGFAHFIKGYKLDSRKRGTLKMHHACRHFDMAKYCRCDLKISELCVYFNDDDDDDDEDDDDDDDDDFHLMEPEYTFTHEGKLWKDPKWKVLPSRFCTFLAHFTELVPMRDMMRQNSLVEDLLEHFDDGALRGASMWTVVLSVHVCCMTCIMLRLQFRYH